MFDKDLDYSEKKKKKKTGKREHILTLRKAKVFMKP